MTADPTLPPGSDVDATAAEPADFDLNAEVQGILADPAMPIAEKQQRLQDLADRYGVEVLGPSADLDGDGEISPLELQIAEALGMLAEGGHSYREEDEPPAEGDVATLPGRTD